MLFTTYSIKVLARTLQYNAQDNIHTIGCIAFEVGFLDAKESQTPSDASTVKYVERDFSKATVFVACASLGLKKTGSENPPRVCVIY